MLFSMSVFAQNPTLTYEKEFLSDSITKLIVTNPDNGRIAEYAIDKPLDEVAVEISLSEESDNGTQITTSSGDQYLQNILLPDENGGVVPMASIEAGDNTLVYGGKRILILNGNNEVLMSYDVSDFGSMDINIVKNQFFPQWNFLQKKNGSYIFCATIGGELLWIDPNSYEVVGSFSGPSNYNIQSSQIKYDEINDRLFWAINYWEGKTYFYEFLGDGSTIPLAELQFNEQINDFDFDTDNERVFVAFGDNNGNLRSYNYSLELLVDENISYLNGTRNIICHENSIYLLSRWLFLYEDDIYDVAKLGYNDSEFYFKDAISTFDGLAFYMGLINKSLSTFYVANSLKIRIWDFKNKLNLQTYQGDGDAGKLRLDVNDEYLYFGNREIIGRMNETIIDFTLHNRYQFSEIRRNHNSIYGLDAKHGKLAFFDIPSLNFQNEITTAVYANRGVISRDGKKAFFIDALNDLHQGTLLILNTENNEISANIPLDAFLIDIAYNDNTNRIAISNLDDQYTGFYVTIFDDNGNELKKFELEIPSHDPVIDKPKKLFSDGNYVYVNAVHSIWRIDMQSLSLELIVDFPDFNGDNSYRATDFAKNKQTNTIYTVLQGGLAGANSMFVSLLNGQVVTSLPIDNYMQESIAIDEVHNKVYLSGGLNMSNNGPIIGKYNGETLEKENQVEIGIPGLVVTSVDINYSPYQEKLYFFSNGIVDPSLSSQPIFKIYDKNLVEEESKSVKANPYGFIKDQLKDQTYLGNCKSISGEMAQTLEDLDNLKNQWFPDLLLNGNYLSNEIKEKKLFNLARTPIRDTKNKTVKYFYTPNYGFSNISVIEVKKDIKKWDGKIKWLSFPRMERYSFGDVPCATQNVLSKARNFPRDLQLIYMGKEAGYIMTPTPHWDDEDIPTIQSTKGYKLSYGANGKANLEWMEYQGGKEDPETEFYISQGENWVGYFLEYPQKPEEAFASIIDDITYIKAQYWAMYREYPGGPFTYVGKVTPLEYGDMVIIYAQNAHPNFQWNQGSKKDPVPALKTEYYSYEEKLDYEPVFVLTDENSDVQEIAVKVDGEVKGAAVREAGDTLVQVNAYLEGVDPNAQLELETYSGGKGAVRFIPDYLVKNPRTSQMEKRKLFAGERARFQVVSIRSKDQGVIPDPMDRLSVYPNPAAQDLHFEFLLNQSSRIQMRVYNNLGQVVATPLQSSLNKGYHSLQWDLGNGQGQKVPAGVYFYSIDFPDLGIQKTGKIMIR